MSFYDKEIYIKSLLSRYKVGEFLTETYWDHSSPQGECSRNIARQLLGKLDDLGLKMYSAMELEFFLLDKQNGKPVFTGIDFWSTLTQSEFDSWFTAVDQNMAKLGVSIEAMHIENAPGQFEFVSSPEFGIKGADHSMLLKHGIKELALQRGWEANFMAKVFPQYSGNGGHFNFSIWDKESGENAFWGKDSPDHLSPLAKHWIAGMLLHAKALTALCCITTNCYQRLHAPTYTSVQSPPRPHMPNYASWGIEDRTAMLRVKNKGPSCTYIESRLPSGLFNSYLVMAGTIAAGLDGVQRKLTCPAPHLTDGSLELPHSLQEAICELAKDEIMVKAMGKTFVDLFIQLKTETDLKAIEGLTTQAELLQQQHQEYARLM